MQLRGGFVCAHTPFTLSNGFFRPCQLCCLRNQKRDLFFRNELFDGPISTCNRVLVSFRGSRKVAVIPQCVGYEADRELDKDFVEAMNEVCNKALKVMMDRDEHEARVLSDELEEMRRYVLEESDMDTATFLAILKGMLSHTVLKSAGKLEGIYLKAFNRICSTLEGSDWRLAEEGRSAEVNEEPKFSTWDDVYSGKMGSNQGNSTSGDSPIETDFYDRLGISHKAEISEIKSAYRKLALKYHPDVNSEPDAEQKFMRISRAYDVLSNATSRRLYDEYGEEDMKSREGAGSGQGNSDRFWSEFKPYKKETKRTKARDASRESNAGGEMGEGEEREAVAGDIVEYPLSELVKNDLQDGRAKGVGLLVGRNKDRGDVKTLPDDVVDLCEVEPLRQEEEGSNRWIPDELGVSCFCGLGDLKVIPIASYDYRFDVWTIDAELSEGCGGPEIVEEIML